MPEKKRKIQYSVTDNEHKAIKNAAARKGLTPSQYSKTLVFGLVFRKERKRAQASD